MPFSELFDETLDINSSTNYKLSIQASLDGFYFSITDTLRNKFVMYRQYEPEEDQKFTIDEIVSLFSRDDFLNRSYSATSIMIPSRKCTLVPSGLYDPAGKDDYFFLGHELAGDEVIKVNRLRQPDAYLIFAIDGKLADTLSRLVPGTEPTHHLKPLLWHLHNGGRGSGESTIHLHVEKEFMNIVYFNTGVMKLCNTFMYMTTSDMLYYLLYGVRQLGLQEGWTLTVSGASVMFDEVWSELSLHVSNIKYATPATRTLFSHVFGQELKHRHLNIFNLSSCE